MDINELDDPLDDAPTAPLNPASLTSAIPGQDRRAPLRTLDESVWDTLARDVLAVWAKMKAVLYPKFTFRRWPDAADVLEAQAVGGGGGGGRPAVLGDWDLWGPLLFCLALSTLLSICAAEAQKTRVFAGVFSIVWIGEAVVTAQIKLLGGNMCAAPSLSFPVANSRWGLALTLGKTDRFSRV